MTSAGLAINGNLGIGTTSPTSGKLQVNVSSGTALYINNTGSDDSIVDDSGAKLTAAGVWTDASDRTHKSQIRDLTYGLPDLLKLRPVNYNWKATGTPDIGFIAQEVKDVIPEIVYGEDGNMSLSYSHLTALAVKGIQEQQTQISSLGSQLRDLTISTDTFGSQLQGLTSETRDLSLTADSLTTVTDQLTLKLTDQNTSTTDRLLILASKVDDLEKELSAANSDTGSLEIDNGQIKSRLQDLEDQMALLTEENQAVIDFAKALDTKSLIYKDATGNLNLTGGKITAKDIEALGTLKAKDIEAENSVTSSKIETTSLETTSLELSGDTSGKAKIPSGDTDVTIETPEAAKDSKIYITPEGDTFERILFYDDVVEGKGFKVKIKKPTDEGDIRFNWLIIK